jgi:hypothetical protein
MAIRIEIKDDHIKDLIDFYSKKQKTLREHILKLEKDLRDISATIAQLKQRPNHTDTVPASLIPDEEVFSSKWPWIKKIAYAIKEAGKPITTKEIVDILDAYEPKTEEERKSAVSSVSSTLSVKSGKYSDKKDFIKNISESGEFAYDIWKEDREIENTQTFGSSIVIDDDDDLPF